jgi:hypothetical protein
MTQIKCLATVSRYVMGGLLGFATISPANIVRPSGDLRFQRDQQ